MKAIVFVDCQKDFIDGALKNEKAIEVMPKIVKFAEECVKNGYKLYATRDTHEKTTWSSLRNKELGIYTGGYLTTLEGKRLPVEHCVEGTDGWMIDDRLVEVLDGKCTFVNKPTFGSFDLVEIINEDFFETYQYIENLHCRIKCLPKTDGQTLDEIVIVGFCTGICCLANAILLRAKFPNVKITVMSDLCACVTEDSHTNALECMKMQMIDVVTSDAYVK